MNWQFTKEILIAKCSASIDAKLMLHSDATTLDCQKKNQGFDTNWQ